MLGQLKRRKKLLVAGAAAAAAAGLVYYCWPEDDTASHKEDDKPSRATDSQVKQQQDGEDTSLDASMSSHFQFIQDVSTPHELEHLLPRVQAVLFEMTDVQAGIAALPPDTSVKTKLEVMAQHSIGRALAATWLLPALDLLVRAKLNIVGRHLYLQERLCDLPAAQAQLRVASPFSYQQQALPPRIPAMAIDAFLPCDYFAEEGCRGLVSQVLAVVEGRLSALDLGAERGPEDLILLLQALNAQIASALPVATDRAGKGIDWALLLLGESELPVPDEYSTGSMQLPEHMLQELQQELHAAVSSHQFQQAMTTAVQHCMRLLTDKVVDFFPVAEAKSTSHISAAASRQSTGLGPDEQAAPEAHDASEHAHADHDQPALPAGEVGGTGTVGKQAEQRTWWGYLRSFWPSTGSQQVEGRQRMSMSRTATLQEITRARYANKPPRPMARLLRPVYLAAEPMFADVTHVSQGIAALGPVMELSASIFARPMA